MFLFHIQFQKSFSLACGVFSFCFFSSLDVSNGPNKIEPKKKNHKDDATVKWKHLYLECPGNAKSIDLACVCMFQTMPEPGNRSLCLVFRSYWIFMLAKPIAKEHTEWNENKTLFRSRDCKMNQLTLNFNIHTFLIQHLEMAERKNQRTGIIFVAKKYENVWFRLYWALKKEKIVFAHILFDLVTSFHPNPTTSESRSPNIRSKYQSRGL